MKLGQFDMLPFGEDRPCPKCEGRGCIDRHGLANLLVRGAAEFIDVSGGSGPWVEYLAIRCVQCGWEWLMEPKMYGESVGTEP